MRETEIEGWGRKEAEGVEFSGVEWKRRGEEVRKMVIPKYSVTR